MNTYLPNIKKVISFCDETIFFGAQEKNICSDHVFTGSEGLDRVQQMLQDIMHAVKNK